ncbi:hypothetical protein [Shewanella algidipiscicola]|uniref:Uncharacterized protein n=1 Tax=Shewanella algidipiscicola TaxID=614070 RepID=A0ABQ4NTJ9_9GAMM|nr:hypothetical protein [Shewanella algidipiscicola]GIU03173.1 hypothetical protein TUM4630_36340 [Shewanella algidipiscicola]
MNDKVVEISKSLFFASIAVLFLTASYLAYINPAFNFSLAKEIDEAAAIKRSLELEEYNKKNAKLKEWKWFNWSDVATNSEKYPLVIVRNGFKVINISDIDALVGCPD